MTENTPELPSKLLIDIDDVSVGFYPFPIATYAPELVPGVETRTTLVADRTESVYKLPGLLCRVPKEARFRPQGMPEVRSFIRRPRQVAWASFLAALPYFWLSRYKVDKETRKQLEENSGVLDLVPFRTKRKRDRQQLSQHSSSLIQKTWAVRYHSQRFLQHIDRSTGGSAENIFIATCELNATEGTLYGLLDEVALMMNLMFRISGRGDLPHSFSDLRKTTRPEFQALFADMPWYEAFHERRTGAAHAFTPRVLALSDDDIRLFQHPHPRYTRTNTDDFGDARTVVKSLSRHVDNFLCDLACLLLSGFHPCDTLTQTEKQNSNDVPTEDTVWVRQLTFTEKPGSEQYLDPLTGEPFMTHTPERPETLSPT